MFVDDICDMSGRVDPQSDIEVVETGGESTDLERATGRRRKEARATRARKRHCVLQGARRWQDAVRRGGGCRRVARALTTKPFLYVFNADRRCSPTARVGELRVGGARREPWTSSRS